MNGAHSLLAPSAAERWINCPPSVKATADLPDVQEEYAEEGTLGHDLAKCHFKGWLDNGGPPVDYEIATLRSHKLWTKALEEAALEYVEQVKIAYQKALAIDASAIIVVERRVSLEGCLPEPGAGGTPDVRIVYGNVLETHDLKMGVGVPVDAENNAQCRMYSFGELEEIKDFWPITDIVNYIHQPRLNSVTRETLTRAELEEWIDRVVRPAATLAWEGRGEFKPGEWCQFCKIRTSCAARARQHMAEASAVFTAIEGDETAAQWSLEQIGALLPKIPGLRAFLRDVEAAAMKAALAGKTVPGHELDEGRSNRIITDASVAAQALIDAGVPEALLYERVMIPLTTIEKVAGKKLVKSTIGHLIEKPPGAPKLVEAGTAKKPYNRLDQAKAAFRGAPRSVDANGVDITEWTGP